MDTPVTNAADSTAPGDVTPKESLNFLEQIIVDDRAAGKHAGRVHTRFPPEPNGYLHMGHAKSICLNFGLAEQFGGECNLRFDDTNPIKEEQEFVESIREDVSWLGFTWSKECYASDYFETLYTYAQNLIRADKAYVCDLTPDQMREYRGNLTQPGRPSPFRDRSVDENLALFADMRAGKFADGTRVLRAKINMASPNINMRDPVMYRILTAHHHRTGDTWRIYPTYDFTHGQSDSLENITHSICTLEFENHRPLYDWYIDALDIFHPQQIEFARLNLTYTVMSKRKLKQLVEEGHVKGWDDPRLPTISGMRRRGITPSAIRAFCKEIGVSKYDGTIEIAKFEHVLREDLNRHAVRRLGVLNPLKVVLTNFPADTIDYLDAANNPEQPESGSRQVPFTRELYVDRDDFMEVPEKGYFRLAPGAEVRLRFGYFITCREVIKDALGQVIELHCTYDPETRGGAAPDKRRVKGTIHWVSATQCIDAEVRVYDHLFSEEFPEAGDKEFLRCINPSSLTVLTHCKLEPSLASADVATRYQFERVGYFCIDPRDSRPDHLVFNRTISLKDTYNNKAKPKAK